MSRAAAAPPDYCSFSQSESSTAALVYILFSRRRKLSNRDSMHSSTGECHLFRYCRRRRFCLYQNLILRFLSSSLMLFRKQTTNRVAIHFHVLESGDERKADNGAGPWENRNALKYNVLQCNYYYVYRQVETFSRVALYSSVVSNQSATIIRALAMQLITRDGFKVRLVILEIVWTLVNPSFFFWHPIILSFRRSSCSDSPLSSGNPRPTWNKVCF